MSEKKLSLGQAIDQIIEALESLEATSRQTAINAACESLGIEQKIKATEANNQNEKENDRYQGTQMDIRTFKEQKNPVSAIQMACVVAFYLQELAPSTERKKTVTAADLTTYFKQANFKLPKAIAQVLPDCRVAGYFESAPGKGEYSLNAVGYNLVAHKLPKTAEK